MANCTLMEGDVDIGSLSMTIMIISGVPSALGLHGDIATSKSSLAADPSLAYTSPRDSIVLEVNEREIRYKNFIT